MEYSKRTTQNRGVQYCCFELLPSCTFHTPQKSLTLGDDSRTTALNLHTSVGEGSPTGDLCLGDDTLLFVILSPTKSAKDPYLLSMDSLPLGKRMLS
jgi:hypothetical protein